MAALVKPPALHLGIVQFVALALGARQRLRTPQPWLAWAAILLCVATFATIAHRHYVEHGNTFGIGLGGEMIRAQRFADTIGVFSGIVQIEWLSAGEWRTARVPVSGTGGTVQVGEGTRKVEGRGSDRWIAGVSGWQAGWGEPVTGRVPKPSAHWKLAVDRGPEIAGRTTTVVTATDPGTKRARLKVYVDRDTGIMLRRGWAR